jgi:acetyl-CoA acyltransferase
MSQILNAGLGLHCGSSNLAGGSVVGRWRGHPLGASGARIMGTLLHELERRGARHGLQTICCAGGMAAATVIERLG